MTLPARTVKAAAVGIGAPPAFEETWDQINWAQVTDEVTRLQVRIAKATREGRWNKIQALLSVVTLCDAAMFKYVDGRRRAPCESGDGAEPHRRCSEGFLLIGSRCDRRIDAHVVLLVVEAVDLSAVVRLESEHQFMKEVEDFDG